MQSRLSDLIRSYTIPYDKRLTRSPSDAREYAALVDFQIKVALTLLAAYSSRADVEIKLGDTPGVGQMLSGIRLAKRWSDHNDAIILGWRHFAEGFLSEFAKNIHDGKSFKVIRDELSHGNPIPVEDASAEAICTALKDFASALAQRLEIQLDKFTITAHGTSISLKCGSDVHELSPVWDFNVSQGVVGLYSSFDSDGVYYLCPTIGIYRNQRPENTQAFKDRFLSRDPASKHFGQFVFEITRDIAGFSEDHSAPPYDFGEGENAGVVYVTWTQPSSNSSTHRTDAFRRGIDNRYEWLDVTSGDWLGYSAFLRKIANWSLLARRIQFELDEQQRRKQIAETGTTQAGDGMKIDAILIEQSVSVDSAASAKPLDLQSRVDGACLPSKSFTTVFFVVGDAGMGKTELLLTLARNRARAVELNPSSDLPIYLFVSSTGRALSNLDDAINTSLSMTRMLDNHSAKALCRNGLLVLVVDGFDELLGSSGYDNPLGSLEGWFRDLRGRGVMIASARSAYYMTSYRRSLSETTDLNVEHTVADIQPWSRQETERFLLSYGLQDADLSSLNERDWRLLTIPFFAKAFATWCMSRSTTNGAPSGVFSVVIEQYLERESLKILDQHGKPILSKPELQTLFSEFAEMMHLEGRRELEQSALELCACAALEMNDLERERAGLRRRLSSLCGLSAGDVVAGDSKFGFSHEVIYDCFLSLCLQRRCEAGVERVYISNFFAKAAINPAVIEWFVVAAPGAARTALDVLIPLDPPSVIWRSNVGNLWTAVLNQSNGMPPSLSASELVFQAVELTRGSGRQLAVRNASIEHLILSRDAATVDVSGTSIKLLEVDETSTLRLLRNVSLEMVQRIQSPTLFCDNTPQIRTVLEDVGVISRQISAASLEWQDTANYFIEGLVNRPDSPIVVTLDDFNPDGDRLRWTLRLGISKWTQFVNRLTQCGLASWETIVAKGRPKGRLVFQVSPAAIARRQSDISAIVKFWSGD